MSYKVLIVVDMQNDFIDGSLGTKEAQEIVPMVENLISSGDFKEIYFTQDTHYNNYLETLEGEKLPIKHCIYNTHGWQISDRLDTSCANGVFEKSTFGFSHWDKYLCACPLYDSQQKEIVLCGLCTDICVIVNAISIKTQFPWYEVSIVENATSGTTPERKQAALDVARSCQINVI